MALMAANGDITPMPDCAIFADTEAEPKHVYKWLDWLETQLPFPIYRVTAGSLRERELTIRVSGKSGKQYRRTAIPAFGLADNGTVGILGRKCTPDHKIIPIIQKLRQLCDVKRGEKSVVVTQWLGISWDEMQRMKDSRESWIKHRWPLIEKRMTRMHCLEYMKSHGYPEPPRSACTFCPFHSNTEWRNLRDNHPEEFADAVKFEIDMQEAAKRDETLRAIPFLHASCTPLDQVDFTDPHHAQYSLLDECDGMCGV